MPPRQAINCGEQVAFIITYNCASALRYPLWLKPPANANGAAATSRFLVIENTLARAL